MILKNLKYYWVEKETLCFSYHEYSTYLLYLMTFFFFLVSNVKNLNFILRNYQIYQNLCIDVKGLIVISFYDT